MAYLSVADLIAGPARLSPAEAAALTLAVARKLDDEDDGRREPRLPGDNGILISSTGIIAFVRGPEAPITEIRTALSALLMRLLQLDGDGPRTHVPGGLLIVLARNLGYIQLPPTSADAFRAALERFATSDPTVIAGIFWRAARLKGTVPRRALPVAAATARAVDRRHSGPTRAELRRALRDVERELYDTRNRLARKASEMRPVESAPSGITMGGMVRWAGIAAGVVLLASIATGGGTRSAQPDVSLPLSVTTQREAPRVVAVSGPATVAARLRPPPAVIPSPDSSTTARAASGNRVTAKAIRRRPPQRTRGPATPDAPARRFAGGARQIPWTIQR